MVGAHGGQHGAAASPHHHGGHGPRHRSAIGDPQNHAPMSMSSSGALTNNVHDGGGNSGQRSIAHGLGSGGGPDAMMVGHPTMGGSRSIGQVGNVGAGPVSLTQESITSTLDGAKSPIPRREVDYYLNPTELFRWINYRRWDGAKARALSNPDECGVWIVSRHSSDGRVLWRHLPIHLVCMQAGNVGGDKTAGGGPSAGTGGSVASSASEAAAQRQIEELLDALLDGYPEGVDQADDQGMLPLHHCFSSGNVPNEKILSLLLISNPTAVDTKDKYGRTPLGVLRENGSGGQKQESAMRSMSRIKRMAASLVASVRDENTAVVDKVSHNAANERTASQRIIVRLEEEVNNLRAELDSSEKRNHNESGVREEVEGDLSQTKERLERSSDEMHRLIKERDDLKAKNAQLQHHVDEHDTVVEDMKETFKKERAKHAVALSKLKSEANTARTMAEAMEAQLRTKFTNEEYLQTTVEELEKKLEKTQSQSEYEMKKLLHQKEALENESGMLKNSVEDLTTKSTNLQTKLSELNKQMGNILSSHGSLNAEHDRMMEACTRHEGDLLEAVRGERTRISDSMHKTKDMFEKALKHQESIMEEAQRREAELIQLAKDDHDRSVDIINKMRQDFREARSMASERERRIAQETLTASKIKTSASVDKDRDRNTGRGGVGGGRDGGRDVTTPSKGSGPGGGGQPNEGTVSTPRRMIPASRSGAATPPIYPSNHREGDGVRSPSPYRDREHSRQYANRSPTPSTYSQTSSMASSPRTSALTQGRYLGSTSNLSSRQQQQQPARQSPTPNGDGSLLRLLEDRAAEQGRDSRGVPSSPSSSSIRGPPTDQFGSSRTTPKIRGTHMNDMTRSDGHHSVKFATPSVCSDSGKTPQRRTGASSGMSSSSPHHTNSLEYSNSNSVSLDDYSVANSVASDRSDRSGRSRDSRSYGRRDQGGGGESGRPFHGMNGVMKMGTIRVSNEIPTKEDDEGQGGNGDESSLLSFSRKQGAYQLHPFANDRTPPGGNHRSMDDRRDDYSVGNGSSNSLL